VGGAVSDVTFGDAAFEDAEFYAEGASFFFPIPSIHDLYSEIPKIPIRNFPGSRQKEE